MSSGTRSVISLHGNEELPMTPSLTEPVAKAPWRKAVTCRDAWPHEHVLSEQDGWQQLLAAICERLPASEGVLASVSDQITRVTMMSPTKSAKSKPSTTNPGHFCRTKCLCPANTPLRTVC